MTHPSTSGPARRLPALDSLRAVATAVVVLVHVTAIYYPPAIITGHIDLLGQALTFFFVLSGFLIYLPFAEHLLGHRPRPSARRYLGQRLRRVFPAYVVILALANFAMHAVFTRNPVLSAENGLPGYGGGIPGTGTDRDAWHLVTQFTLTQSLFPSTMQTGLNPAWSLTAEVTFYLLLPALVACLPFPRPGIRAALRMPAVVLVIGLVGTVWSLVLIHRGVGTAEYRAWGPTWSAVVSHSFPAVATQFALGMFAAVLFATVKWNPEAPRPSDRLLGFLIIAGFAAAILSYAVAPNLLGNVSAIPSAALILILVLPGRSQRSQTVMASFDRSLTWLTEPTLSVYLWHYPVLIIVTRTVTIPHTPSGLATAFAAVFVVTLLLATITFRLVEQPAMRWGRSTRVRAAPTRL
ncbi:acyltransferase family protein [Gordonia phthalatica]|uniref:Acyltransferase 3 domain-containing protein n=1 Tax=Gordonia phthalatica TaxID=1136941 RepID=A0A0N9N4U7_9ACTN|nr:acyltransferase [Gordonia phthalatica]ALG85852.1 hypothetical protein ACH46_16875 [Gordonia phthalatica]